MIDLPFEYWNKLANQTLFISALLGGFSLTIIASLIEYKSTNRFVDIIFKAAAIATTSFLISIFAMTKILMLTTEGYPFKVTGANLMFPRLIGIIAFLTGLIAIITIISSSGWTKSKRLGRFTTILGVLALVIILTLLT